MKSSRKKPSQPDVQITLGNGWRQFTQPQTDVELLGVIRRGLEIGALAQDAAGAYLQINGDIRQSLNSSRIKVVLRSAQVRNTNAWQQQSQPQSSRPPVVVIVKPRRRIVMPAS